MADNLIDTVWLTQEAYDKLREEYDHLVDEGRPAVSRKIAQAREEGDLSENGGYHAAREEQGQMEARIRQLKQLLDTAHVGTPTASDEVGPGSKVTIAFDGDEDDTDTFLLGSRELIGVTDTDIEVFSPQSPLGAAIVGAKKGQKVSYTAPTGATINVTVLEFGVFTG